jgi:GrpB-like predicted nucleotidyltransferase (UPF0157 family)
VAGGAPATGINLTDPDPSWPGQYNFLAGRIREALGWRVLQLDHVGSTSVPGLAAKPIIDIDLTVADPGREQDYVPALETIGFALSPVRRSRPIRRVAGVLTGLAATLAPIITAAAALASPLRPDPPGWLTKRAPVLVRLPPLPPG